MDNTNSYSASFCGEYRVKHILIKPIVNNNMDAGQIEKAKEDAKVKTQDIILKLINGGNWTSLVKKYSDDKLSITRDGLMKNFRRSEVEEILYKTVEKLRDGRYTNYPVEASDGYHILFRIGKIEEEEDSKKETDEASEEEIKEEEFNVLESKDKKEKSSVANSYSAVEETKIDRQEKKKAYGISDYEYDSVREETISRSYAENQFSENIIEKQITESMVGNQIEKTIERSIKGQGEVNYSQSVSGNINENVNTNINQNINTNINANIERQINITRPLGGAPIPRNVNVETTISSDSDYDVDLTATAINVEQSVGVHESVASVDVVQPTIIAGVQHMNVGKIGPTMDEQDSNNSQMKPSEKGKNLDNRELNQTGNELQNLENEALNESENIPHNFANEELSEEGEAVQNKSEMASPNSPSGQSLNNINGGMDPKQTLQNTGKSPKLQERLERSRGKNLFNNLLNRNNKQNEDSDKENKNPVKKAGEKSVEKGVSAAAQSVGVPKPIADAASKKVAGPLLDAVKKKYKKKLIIMVACIAAVFLIILIPVIIIAGDSDYQAANSEDRSNYLYGSGSEDELYEYLINIGVCNTASACASTDAATFYKKLKSVLNSNSNLTPKQADAFIMEMIFYERTDEEAYKHSNEIEYIANIIGQNGPFNVANAQSMVDSFTQNGGYFDTYRQDLLTGDNSVEYKKSMFIEICENAVTFSNMLNESENNSNPIGGTCGYDVNGKIVSNVKVRLLECDDHRTAKPINNELIDFEKYITGVVYAEIGDGSKESFKTEAIAARNYSLLRGDIMGGNLGLKNENGEWILSIRNCTKDQVYCDPDKGCWTSHRTAGDTVYSGTNENKAWGHNPLPQNSELRKAVAETAGKVLVDSSGKMINISYTNTQHQEWNKQAKEGKDHFEMLKETYPTATKIISTCTTGSITGDFSLWKQYDNKWGAIPLGKSAETIKSAGCAVTSVAIQIARSGTTINIENFNPGTFVQRLNNSGGFTNGGGLYWNSPSSSGVAPNFQYIKEVRVKGTISERNAQIKSYIDQGYYIVIQVKSNTHWVAIDYINGDNAYMNDPGSSAVNLWQKYGLYDQKIINEGNRIILYKNNG